VAEVLRLSVTTVKRDWRVARAWLAGRCDAAMIRARAIRRYHKWTTMRVH
jgi:ECF sigma factor